MTTINYVLEFARNNPVHPGTRQRWKGQSVRFFAWATRLVDPELGITSPSLPLDAIAAVKMSGAVSVDAMPIPGDFLWWGNLPHGDVAMVLEDWKVLWLNPAGVPLVMEMDALAESHTGPYRGLTETFCGIRVEEE